MTLAKDSDFFIVDSQYTPEELPDHIGWGHSSWKSIETGIQAGVKRIALYHHDPYHEDGDVSRSSRTRVNSIPMWLRPAKA